VHDLSVCPFHIKNVKAVQPNDHFAREEFRQWLLRDQILCTTILFTEAAFFNRDEITNTRNSHVWSPLEENPHAIPETRLQTRSSVNIWCGIIRNLLWDRLYLETAWQRPLLTLLAGRAATAIRIQASGSQAGDVDAHFDGTAFLNRQFPES
jgi:hypothetical protein